VRQNAATFDLSASPLADNQTMLSGAKRELYWHDPLAVIIDLILPL
jgi:hypothetical protein